MIMLVSLEYFFIAIRIFLIKNNDFDDMYGPSMVLSVTKKLPTIVSPISVADIKLMSPKLCHQNFDVISM